MTEDELLFFNRFPAVIPIYQALKDRLEAAYPELRLKIAKTQISFFNRRMFAMASPPWRRVKGWPAEYLLVSFGLSYPNRWTHHVIVTRSEEIDLELLAWLDEAYRFAAAK